MSSVMYHSASERESRRGRERVFRKLRVVVAILASWLVGRVGGGGA